MNCDRGISPKTRSAWRRESSGVSGALRPDRCPGYLPPESSCGPAGPAAHVGFSSSRSRKASPSRPVRVGEVGEKCMIIEETGYRSLRIDLKVYFSLS